MSWQSLPVSGSILTVSWQGCLHFCSSCSDSCLSCSIRFSLDPSICRVHIFLLPAQQCSFQISEYHPACSMTF
uniref:Uncharacterized protein n=1 Tax=Anguilla anguilla TaxID=7936 RepID=A0A0E9VQU3_ANGAN